MPYLYDDAGLKVILSPTYNLIFNKHTGTMRRWGTIPADDPTWSPFSPEIADIETVVDGCFGSGNGPCNFCAPENELVNTPLGMVEIQHIASGDIVYSLEDNVVIENVVHEIYTRQYNGDLIIIELNDGRSIRLTPDHEVFTVRGLIRAGELVEDDDIIEIYRNSGT